MERISATLDKETLTAIRRVAGRRGVSRFIQTAARERLARLELLSVLEELDERYGSIPRDVTAEVNAQARRLFRTRRR